MSTPTPAGQHALRGHQAWVEWRGATHLTLASLWPDRPRAVVVGLAPVPCSVEAGHYFQGQVGRRQLERLAATGLFPPPTEGRHHDDGALAAGVGFTNVVRRPASGRDGVTPEEVEHGRREVLREVVDREVELVVCLTRLPVRALLGREGSPGFQPEPLGGAEVFRMPSPFAPLAEVDLALGTLRSWLAADR